MHENQGWFGENYIIAIILRATSYSVEVVSSVTLVK